VRSLWQVEQVLLTTACAAATDGERGETSCGLAD